MQKELKYLSMLVIGFTLQVNSIMAQKVSGAIIDSDSKKPVPYATVTTPDNKKGVTSDFEGKFTIAINLNDTIVISSIGYHQIKYVIKNYEPITFLIPPQSYFLNEVKVKSEDDVPLMYKSVVFPEGDPGIGAAIVNPLSYWYYKLSKAEKSKREIRDLLDYEKRMAKVMKIYNKELVAEFSGLTGESLDLCFAFCNAKIDLVENDDEFTIKFKLLEVLTAYNSNE